MNKILIIAVIIIVGVTCYFGREIYYIGYSTVAKMIAEPYLKNKIVNEYQDVAKLLDLNSTSDSKNLVDTILQKINTPSLNLAVENQKLKEENQKLQDILTQKERNIKGMLK